MEKKMTYPFSMEKALDLMCDYLKVKKSAIISKSRVKDLVYKRQMMIYWLRSNTNMTYSQIGELFGGRDHTTIIHSCTEVDNRIVTYERERETYLDFETYINKNLDLSVPRKIRAEDILKRILEYPITRTSLQALCNKDIPADEKRYINELTENTHNAKVHN